ncbi:putative phage tail protein [Sinorhizobium sp. BG8]|uniref:putative phage tail protein n=1 Tax=Sinorhizobium sp. BG8 TaxID=2613773 RepID=UPI00193C9360|nr:putative phage tail protein [Sinorhizobium sp. BG8]QRM55156.1 DUF2313 domain-containing protein [Sinorhizobium sp. BG8]
MSRSPVFHTITRGYTEGTSTAVAEPADALSAPTNDDLITAGLSLWPQGAAWGSPDGEAVPLSSNLARFTRVLLDGLVLLYARAFRVAIEASPRGAAELLDAWEDDHGLPEPCFSGDRTTTERLSALADKVRGGAVAHPTDFIRVAAAYGFEIEIEEPDIFTCGLSECASYHETGDGSEETYWIVRVKDSGFSYFEAGAGECGYDPLFSFGVAEEILCLLRKLAPAWTIPVLMPWIDYALLITDSNAPIIDEYGNPLFVSL